ncbi:MAG TPA: carboxypeptidase-like regulatory domain-containing protein [Bacteroidales bacterium]|nr:carboxypeptidase-like regulatory domain-containing protein [Bacteroidales bacterium]
MRIKLLLLLCLVTLAGSLRAQKLTQTIRGEVTDKNTGITLPVATVVILNTNPIVGTTTDESGKYRFSDISIARVSLKVSFVGYADAVISNLNLTTGRELVVNVLLEELAIPLAEVVVKADAQKERPANRLTLVSARSFTVEETERYAGSRADVDRMAANYAGVLGVDDSRNDIIIRGNSPMGLLWRLEGVDIPNPNHWGAAGTTGGPVCMLDYNLLENSDFITGAFSAEYGNDISGAFDLRMRSGNNEKFEFLGQIGFNGFEFGAEGSIAKRNGSSFLVNYRYSTLGVFDKLGMDLGTVGVPYYQDLSFKVNFPRTSIGSFSIFGLGGKSDIEIWDSRGDTLKDKIDFYGGEGFGLSNDSNMGVVGLNHKYSVNQSTFTKLSVAASAHQFKTDMDSLSNDLTQKYSYYRNNFIENTFYANFSISKKISSKNFIKFGAIAKLLAYSYTDSVYKKNEDLFQILRSDDGKAWLTQPYFNWQYRPNNSLTINAGFTPCIFF